MGVSDERPAILADVRIDPKHEFLLFRVHFLVVQCSPQLLQALHFREKDRVCSPCPVIESAMHEEEKEKAEEEAEANRLLSSIMGTLGPPMPLALTCLANMWMLLITCEDIA